MTYTVPSEMKMEPDLPLEVFDHLPSQQGLKIFELKYIHSFRFCNNFVKW